ncbi:MAG TPA: EAL domain-containing protein [Croceibacterium sp.]|nr:EAL domain-containing protein [Croceibacterium sp.]
MDASAHKPLPHFANSGDTRWITATVALFAMAVFVVTGSQVMPYVVSVGQRAAPPPELATAFVLNVALLLLAWRRSVQLKASFAQQRAAELKIRHLAFHDEVTGLHNRRHLQVIAGELLESGETDVALLLMDLDQFKGINDLHGHEAGDAVLISTADKLLSCCAKEDCCVRLGGDEFAVLLRGARARGRQPLQLAEKLIEEFARPIDAAGALVAVGASIGVARVQGGPAELRALLRRADLAMYEAKNGGKNRCVEFDEEMEIALGKRSALESEIRHGVMAGEFVPYFQPIIELASGEVKGFEALARWQHPSKGMLEPPAFLEAAEASGLIGEISLSVMEQAMLAARNWPSHLKIAVNMSAVQFKDPLLSQRLLRILAVTNFPAQRLELEIPESCLIANRDYTLANIQGLQAQGIGIVVDDFGTGYASLTHLRSLPFDRIKIDHSFVKLLESDEQCEALVTAIATLGKGLSIPLAAEGIESTAIQSKLVALGCADAQGWLFAKALSPDQVDDMVGGASDMRIAKAS